MKKILIIISSLVIFGCSLNDERNLNLVCNGTSVNITVDELTKKESKETISNNKLVYKIENGKYGEYECKFTKDEILCNTSKPENDSNGLLKINRVSGVVSDILTFNLKVPSNKVIETYHLRYDGQCENSKQNKF